MKRNTIRSGAVNALFMGVAIVTTFILLFTSYRTSQTFNQLSEMTERHNVLQKAAFDMKQGSDFLTEQVRLFVETGDREYADNFFTEIYETKRRTTALESVRKYIGSEEATERLSDAMKNSSTLQEIEVYAIRLMADAMSISVDSFPSEVGEVVLLDADVPLSAPEKVTRRRELVFNETYQDYKKMISEDVSFAIDRTLLEASQRQQTLSRRHSAYQSLENMIVAILFVIIVAYILVMMNLIIIPLREFNTKILEKDFLPVKGSSELVRIAESYNGMLTQIQTDQQNLSYEATHDPLTGLYNRKVFEDLRSGLLQQNSSLLILDVDYFKSINDNYGHDVGDKVLQKMARALSANFRSEDYPCRIGGDEFAVVMVHTDSSLRHVIERKVQRISAFMNDTSDGLPYNSISAGIAFPDRKDPSDDIFADADAALYKAKEAGRNGYRFYE
ncbi:MAG: GGDEF domain-containing protein [Oscillospiraceae bacterium]|nr:GGDEF domain-containing protein [Oscillospiraceae bacterium]